MIPKPKRHLPFNLLLSRQLFFFPLLVIMLAFGKAPLGAQTLKPTPKAPSLVPPYQYRTLPRFPFPFRNKRPIGKWVAWETATGDVDGDGDPDLFVANPSYGPPTDYFKNLGDGRFKPAAKTSWPPYYKKYTNTLHHIALGDIDGDGDLDFVGGFNMHFATLREKTSIRVFLNQNHGNFVDVSSQFLPKKGLSLNIEDLILIDVDGDKDLDIFFTLAGTIYDVQPGLFLNDGKGKFTDVSGTLPATGSTFRIRAADLDGDKDLDLLLGVWGISYPRILINNGKGRFSDQTIRRFPFGYSNSPAFDIADVDGDGDLDIAFASGAAALEIFENNGKGYFRRSKKTFFKKTKHSSENLLFIDPDQDGDKDILISTTTYYPKEYRSDYNLRYYENTGNGVFLPKPNIIIPYRIWDAAESLSLVDLDEDGDQDILFLPNAGTLEFTYRRIFFNTFHQLYPPRPPERGKLYTLEIHGRPTEVVRIFASFFRKRTALSSLGIFRLDPSKTTILSNWLKIPKQGPAIFNIPIPNLPSLKGLPLSTQAFHLDYLKPLKSRFGNVLTDRIR